MEKRDRMADPSLKGINSSLREINMNEWMNKTDAIQIDNTQRRYYTKHILYKGYNPKDILHKIDTTQKRYNTKRYQPKRYTTQRDATQNRYYETRYYMKFNLGLLQRSLHCRWNAVRNVTDESCVPQFSSVTVDSIHTLVGLCMVIQWHSKN